MYHWRKKRTHACNVTNTEITINLKYFSNFSDFLLPGSRLITLSLRWARFPVPKKHFSHLRSLERYAGDFCGVQEAHRPVLPTDCVLSYFENSRFHSWVVRFVAGKLQKTFVSKFQDAESNEKFPIHAFCVVRNISSLVTFDQAPQS